MNRNDVDRLLVEARNLTNHTDYVIIGSLSVLGAVPNPPVAMTGSIDVDLYPKRDPGRASEIALALGLGSAFERQYGYYADAADFARGMGAALDWRDFCLGRDGMVPRAE